MFLLKKNSFVFLFYIIFHSCCFHTTNSIQCTSEEFLCEGRNSYPDECIPQEFLCDEIMDCRFGQDEWNCNNCYDSFICASGDCIPNDWVCDSIWDCPNQDDELPSQCVLSHDKCASLNNSFICTNTNNRCVPFDQVCNEKDFDGCLDGQEELNCLTPTTIPTQAPIARLRRSQDEKKKRQRPPCKTDEYQCKSRGSYRSECINKTLLCDGYSDCEFSDDEWNCNYCNIIDGFICESTGDCIPNRWVCDGIWDCPNQEDESPTQCPLLYEQCISTSNHFICNNTNNLCINNHICNDLDYDGCIDGQEEFNCGKSRRKIKY